MYSTGHYLIHCPANVLTALIIMILGHFELSLPQYGMIATIIGLTEGLCSPFAGVLADRFNKRIFPPVSMMLMGGAALTLGLAGGTSIYLFVGCHLFMAFAGALFHPTSLTIISDRFKQERSKAFSLFSLGGQSGFGTGPLTVAALIWLGGGVLKNWQVAYFIWSIPIIGMSIILIITHSRDPTIGADPIDNNIQPNKEIKSEQTPDQLTSTTRSRKSVIIPAFILLLVILSMRSFGRNLYRPFIVLFLVEMKQISEATAVFYLSMLTLAGLPGTILGGYGGDKWGEKKVLIASYGVATLSLLLVLLFQNPILLIAFVLLALGQNAAMPIMNSLIAKIVPLKDRGKAYGFKFLGGIVIGSIAPVTASVIIHKYDFVILFLSAISLFAIATVLVAFLRIQSATSTKPEIIL